MADHLPALVDHDNRKHALLGSSKASIWSKCAGAAQLWLSDPQPFVDSPEAAEGRKVAAIVERCGKTGGPLPEGYEAAQIYLDVIAAEANRYLDPQVSYESDRLYPLMEARNPHCGGTPDAFVVDGNCEGFSVIDLKWGEGVQVVAKNNAQLLDYARGVLLYLREWGRVPDDDMPVRLIIVQPRWRGTAQPVWELTIGQLVNLARYQETLASNIRYHISARVPLPRTAGEHCRWCPNAGMCPEKREAMLAPLPELELEPPKPQDISVQQLVRVLTLAPLIRSWLGSVQQYALGEALAGRLPGFKAVAGDVGDRAWAQGVAPGVIAAAAKQLGVNPYAEPELLSPTQMEKAVHKAVIETRGKGKRGNPEAVQERMGNLSPYISRKPGAPTLAPESDPRLPFTRAYNLPDDLPPETRAAGYDDDL